MKPYLSPVAIAVTAVCLVCGYGCGSKLNGYQGVPFEDSVYEGGAQHIPGKVLCAYYDTGGEGITYHDTTPNNQGSGEYNPLNGTYLHAFRIDEGVDTSYTKSAGDIDNSPYNFITPPMELLYIGWTVTGEWTKYTVRVDKAGTYAVSVLYTSNRDNAQVTLAVNDAEVLSGVAVPSTYRADEPVRMRQWHHWNIAPLGEVTLKKGVQVLTLLSAGDGGMNFGWLDFELQ